MKNRLVALFMSLLAASAAFGQGFTVYTTQRLVADSLFVDIMINAASTAFVPSTSSFFLNYNNAALGSPSKVAANDGPWSTASDLDYLTVRLNTGTGYAGLTVEFQGGTNETGKTVTTESERIGTMKFLILNHALTAGFSWRGIDTVTQLYRLTSPGVAEGGSTPITLLGFFDDPDALPLPIQLAGLSAELMVSNRVRVTWKTLSETDNYGFEVQKSPAGSTLFTTIANSFVAGHGTTTEQHNYTFVDPEVPGAMYRLKQIDRDGTTSFSEAVAAGAVTGVTEKPVPTAFALDQNYPNPFNPATVIEFALPRESRVRLDVYSLLGQLVTTLVDDVRNTGYHAVRFDAANLASGVYIYRLQAGEFSFVRKLVVLK